MALKLNVDNLDGIDEALRPLYVEKDGKFSLDVDGIEDTTAIKGALQKERKEREAREKQVKQWEKFGKTPDEIATLLEEREKRELSEAERKGDFDKIRAQIVEQHRKDLADLQEKLASKDKAYQSKVIDAESVSAIAAEGGVPELLLPHVQRFVKTDDNFNPIVVDGGGTQRFDGKGEPMSIRDLVREMRSSDIFGRAFNGSGQSGSGTHPANGGGGIPQIKTKADIYKNIDPKNKRAMDQARQAFLMAQGPDAYQALPDR